MIQLKSLLKEATDWNSIDWVAAEKKYIATKKVSTTPKATDDEKDTTNIEKLTIDSIFEKYKLGYRIDASKAIQDRTYAVKPGTTATMTSSISYIDALQKLINSNYNVDEDAFLNILEEMSVEDIKTLVQTYYDELDGALLGKELYDKVFDEAFGFGTPDRNRFIDILKSKGIPLLKNGRIKF